MKGTLMVYENGNPEIAWAAGIIEGEGCIMFKVSPQSIGRRTTRIRVTMCDEDIVRRLYNVFRIGRFRGPLARSYSGKSVKDLWLWEVNTQSHVKEVLDLILPWLGLRRAEKAREVLDFIATATPWPEYKTASAYRGWVTRRGKWDPRHPDKNPNGLRKWAP